WILALTLVVAWQHQSEQDVRLVGRLSLAGLVVTLLAVVVFWWRGLEPAGLELMVALDGFRYAMSTVFLLGAILAVMLSLGYLGRERIVVPEYYLLVLLATLGMMFMSAGADLVVIFLGLELMSVSVYVLAGINRRSVFAAEAALKYFLLGAFASGFLLYGIALVYGATGTTNLTLIFVEITSLELQSNVMLIAGVALLLVGFGFKVAAVPFHMWTPDVYDGAPTPVTAFMAAAVKAAAFAALLRILLQALGPVDILWTEAVWWLAAVTMVVGNLIALAQRQLKRMLAYSSIGHAGYLLVAVASGTDLGVAATLYYLFVYTLMTLGGFGVLAAAGRGGEREFLIDDLNGLAGRRPWVAFAMTVFMLSLLGFPGTAGFIGKWYILSAAIDADLWTLAIVLVGASVVSAGYYLPVIMAMYMKPAASETAHEAVQVRGAARWVVAATAVLLLVFGVWPNRVMDLAREEGKDLRPEVMITVSR
ncbi:MAG: NADH-quinone oxidoreductase subunit N, partial [Gemmatimonadota bacterium]|nr:NADH-quinone oxidoreductase subunit N [Gemmatimonadota bacterium]